MVYTTLGVAFIIVFGVELFLERVWWAEEELEGHPMRVNNSVLVPVTDSSQDRDDATEPSHDRWQRGAIIYMAFLCTGMLESSTLG